MNKVVHVGLLGFGTVGGGVVQIFQNNAAMMARKTGAELHIKKILVRDLKKPRAVHCDAALTTDPADILNDPEIQIVVELLGGEESDAGGAAKRQACGDSQQRCDRPAWAGTVCGG